VGLDFSNPWNNGNQKSRLLSCFKKCLLWASARQVAYPSLLLGGTFSVKLENPRTARTQFGERGRVSMQYCTDELEGGLEKRSGPFIQRIIIKEERAIWGGKKRRESRRVGK